MRRYTFRKVGCTARLANGFVLDITMLASGDCKIPLAMAVLQAVRDEELRRLARADPRAARHHAHSQHRPPRVVQRRVRRARRQRAPAFPAGVERRGLGWHGTTPSEKPVHPVWRQDKGGAARRNQESPS